MRQDDFQRLREENAALREENATLRETAATLRALVEELLPLKQRVEELSMQVKQLESRLSKDSHNSHLPPSSDRFARQKKTKSLRKQSGNQPGGQPGHEGNTLSQVSDPDQRVVHRVETCEECQHDLHSVPALMVERRQVLDLPPKRVIVVEHLAEQKVCPNCQSVTHAPFPEGVSAPMQYGPAFGAVAVYLTQQQFLPYERACDTIQDLLGPAMTVGTLKALVQRCATNLHPVEEQIKEHLKQAEVVHSDETGMYVMGKRLWMHVAATAHLTHYGVHTKRGSDAVEAIGILPGFAGISVHDGWGTYWKYAGGHALCNVHHLRELTFLHEAHQQEWAGEMKSALTGMHEAVKQAREQGLSALHPTEVADWKARYHSLLQEGYQANPPDPPEAGATIKRGRRKQSLAGNLLDRLCTHQDAVLLFLERFDVPFDNSQAERDLRMVKVQQKISGSFRSLPGAQAFCRIRGYLSTLRKQGAHLLTALELALAGHPVSPTF
jgi:transposase